MERIELVLEDGTAVVFHYSDDGQPREVEFVPDIGPLPASNRHIDEVSAEVLKGISRKSTRLQFKDYVRMSPEELRTWRK